jgi:hypothetical protein
MISRSWARLRSAVFLAYSAVVMATAVPGFSAIPHTIVVIYYLILPGYAFTLVLRQAQGIAQTAFFSLAWSVTIFGSMYSLTSLSPRFSTVPINGIVPVLTVVLAIYGYYHNR